MTELYVAIAGIVGVAAGGILQMVTAWGIRRWDEKREYRKLAIEAALENWRHQNALKIDIIKSGGTGDASIESPDAYIIHMLRIINMAADMRLTPSEAANQIARWTSGKIDSDGKPKK
jgi:hypothetical protein